MRILVVIYLLCMLRCYASAKYTNQWAVDIYGGPEEADLVAKETGCINDGKQIILNFGHLNYLIFCKGYIKIV